jgi:predicted GNAT family N-acyltransferase
MDGPGNILSPRLYQKLRLLSDVTVICEQGCHFVAIDDTVVNHHAIYLQSFDGEAVIVAFRVLLGHANSQRSESLE